MTTKSSSQLTRRDFLTLICVSSAAALAGTPVFNVLAAEDDLLDVSRITVRPLDEGSQIRIPTRRQLKVKYRPFILMTAPVTDPLDASRQVEIQLQTYKAYAEFSQDADYPYTLVLNYYQTIPPGATLTLRNGAFEDESYVVDPAPITIKAGLPLEKVDTRYYLNRLGPFPTSRLSVGWGLDKLVELSKGYTRDTATSKAMLSGVLEQFEAGSLISAGEKADHLEEWARDDQYNLMFPDGDIRAAVTILGATSRFAFIKDFLTTSGNYHAIYWKNLANPVLGQTPLVEITPGIFRRFIWFNKRRRRFISVLDVADTIVHEVMHFERGGPDNGDTMIEERCNRMIHTLVYGYLLSHLHSKYRPLYTQKRLQNGTEVYDAAYFSRPDFGNGEAGRDLGFIINSGMFSYKGQPLYDRADRHLSQQYLGSEIYSTNLMAEWKRIMDGIYGSDERNPEMRTPIGDDLNPGFCKAFFDDPTGTVSGGYFTHQLLRTLVTQQALMDAEDAWHLGNVLSDVAVAWNLRDDVYQNQFKA